MSGETVTEDREEEVAVVSHSTDLERQFLVLYTDNRLYEGQYKIHITYIGNLNNVLQGFYRSSYKVGNTTRYELHLCWSVFKLFHSASLYELLDNCIKLIL